MDYSYKVLLNFFKYQGYGCEDIQKEEEKALSFH